MFIIQNKKTKLFPTRHGGDKKFPLTTGEELNNRLDCYYSENKKTLEEYFSNELDDLYSPNIYEIVEYEPCDPFYVREPANCKITLSGYGNIEFNTNIDKEAVYDEYDEAIKCKDETEIITVPAYLRFAILELIEGRASISYFAKTDEGSEYRYTEIELVYNDEGFPYWKVDVDSGGTDCDGPIEYHNYYVSHGGHNTKWSMICNFGSEYSDEKYERELKWHSPTSTNPDKRGYKRDYRAEEAGY